MNHIRTAAVFFFLGIFVSVSTTAFSQRSGLFSDVKSGQFFTTAVEEMAQRGVISGYGDGRFGPNDPLTRGQVAVLLQRYDQTVIDPLREQISLLAGNGGEVICGDGIVEGIEGCDDGNTNDGDGCSARCVRERTQATCSDGRNIGDRYRSADGRKLCTCTVNGPECVLNAAESTVCGNGICEAGEDDILFCPSSCRVLSSGKIEGNCKCVVKCQQDCEDGQSCRDRMDDVEEYIDQQQRRTCRKDSDCTVYQQVCPYFTCGEAIHNDALQSLQDMTRFMVNTCKSEEQIACGSCSDKYTAVCEDKRCVLKVDEQ